jgi:hypothetical protein
MSTMSTMRSLRGLTAVLANQIAERWRLLAASLGLGLLPLLLPWLVGDAPARAGESRDTAALVLALLVLGLTALLLGATALATDLAERRLGFWFSRPLGGWVIWAGRLGAAVVCAWTAGFLVLLPSLLVPWPLVAHAAHTATVANIAAGAAQPRDLSLPLLVFAAAMTPLLVLVTHLVSVMLRTRSVWLLLDLGAAAGVAAAAWAIARRLAYWGALYNGADRDSPLHALSAGRVLWAVAGCGLGLIAVGAASAAGIVGGRTDAVRVHRLQSLTLAACGLLGTLILATLAWRWLAVGPGDLERWSLVRAAPGEAWIALAGPAAGPPGYRAAFFLQPATGRAVRARFTVPPSLNLPLAFAADGRRAVWVECEDMRITAAATLRRLDLERPGAQPERVPIGPVAVEGDLALSADGTRVAVTSGVGGADGSGEVGGSAGGARFGVYDVDDGRLLVAPAVDPSRFVQARFVDRDHLRLLTFGAVDASHPFDFALDAYDLEVPSRRLVPRLHLIVSSALTGIDADAGRLLADVRVDADVADVAGSSAMQLFDLATGRPLATLQAADARVAATFLADGRIAERLVRPAGTELIVLDRDGRPDVARVGRTPLFFPASGGNVGAVVLAAPGRLLVRRHAAASSSWWAVDTRTGAMHPLTSVGELAGYAVGRPTGTAPLFFDGTRLLRVDLDSGRRQTVWPPDGAGRDPR